MDRLRLIPLLTAVAIVLFVVKATVLTTETGPALFSSPAHAEDSDAEKGKGEEERVPIANAQTPEETEAPVLAESRRPFGQIEGLGQLASPAEYEILQDLAARRKQLDQREQALGLRAQMLAVAETRLDERIEEIKRIEKIIADSLHKVDEEEEAQIRSLVKVYETMKPKDAARIFDDLEMGILLEVASRMREAKVAPILAKMKSETANSLTVALANRVQHPELEPAIKAAGDPQG